MSFRAGTKTFIAEQGSTWDPVVLWMSNNVAVDLTGWTARMTIRKSIGGPVIANPVCTIPNPIDGKIYLALEETVTRTLPAGSFKYDLELALPDGRGPGVDLVRRLLEGTFKVIGNVTT